MERNIVVTEATGRFIEDVPVEIVERKGIGHPDSLCDGIAERVSVEYTRWCEENLGGPLHHNFDKVQLVAGDVDVEFGRGQILRPIRIQIAGRGTPESGGRKVPMDAIAIRAAKQHISETMKYLDPEKHIVVDCFAGRGSGELVHTVDQIRANDTSFGCANWPRSTTENAVFELAQYLNYDLLSQFPIGEDIKVMGMRRGEQIVLTCAVPFIAPLLKDMRRISRGKAGRAGCAADFRAEAGAATQGAGGGQHRRWRYAGRAVPHPDRHLGRNGGRRFGRARQPRHRADYSLPFRFARGCRGKEPDLARRQDLQRVVAILLRKRSWRR